MLTQVKFFHKKYLYVVKILALFDVFATVFHVWLNRRQLGSHICLCINLL